MAVKIAVFLLVSLIPLSSLAGTSIENALETIEERIESNWETSAMAIEENWQGDPQINFTIKNSGKIGKIEALKSSKSKTLDMAAIAAIKEAVSFIAPTLDIGEIYVRAVFEYKDITLFIIGEEEKINPTNKYERLALISKKRWPKNIKRLVIERSVQFGMTKEQVLLSWGEPDRTNKYVTTYGTREQWVYRDGYSFIYFKNGVVDSWHVSE